MATITFDGAGDLSFLYNHDEWKEYETAETEFDLSQYKNKVIQNSSDEIIKKVDRKLNNNGQGLNIIYEGTNTDYSDFSKAVEIYNRNENKQIKTEFENTYTDAKDAISTIKECYSEMSKEFEDCKSRATENEELSKIEELSEIAEYISNYDDAVKPEFVACVIGNTNTGKSTFINAIIGDAYLPSSINIATSRNVKITDSTTSSKETRVILTIEGEKECGKIELLWENGELKYSCSERCHKYADLIKLLIKNENDCVSQIRKLFSFLNLPNKEENNFCDEFNKKFDNNINLDREKEYFDFNKVVDDNIEFFVPFVNIRINNNELRLVLIDTPGSNDSEKFKEKRDEILKKVLGEQTNSIPICLFDRSGIFSADNDKLKESIESMNGIDICRGFNLISKADMYSKDQLEECIPNSVIDNGMNKWMYVSPAIALGSKKRAENLGYINGTYGDNEDRFDETSSKCRRLYEYNVLPLSEKEEIEEQAKRGKEKKDKYDTIYINSGFTALDYEINKYADTQALYFKVKQSREYLEKAFKKLEEELKKQRMEEKKHKEEHEEKKQDKLEELMNKIDAIIKPYKEEDEFQKKANGEIKNSISEIEDELTKAIKEKINKHIEETGKTEQILHAEDVHDEIMEDLEEDLKQYSTESCNIINDFIDRELDDVRGKTVEIIANDDALTEKSKNKIKDRLIKKISDWDKIKIDYAEMKKAKAGLTKWVFFSNIEEYRSKLQVEISIQREDMKGKSIKESAKIIRKSLDELRDMLENSAETNIEIKKCCDKIKEDDEKINEIEKKNDNLSEAKKKLENIYNKEMK